MKLSELIERLTKYNRDYGTSEVYIETATSEKVRVCQHVVDILIGGDCVILVSKEALDADPLLDLPKFPNLSLVSTKGLPQ